MSASVRIAIIDPAARCVVNVTMIAPAALVARAIEYPPETEGGDPVIETIPAWTPGAGFDFQPHETAEIGWLLDEDDALVPPAPVAEPVTVEELVAYAADRRWQAEQAGTVWNDWPIHTDDRSQGKYLSELQAIALNVRVDGDPWKFADGVFRPLSNVDFPQLAIAAREHARTVFGIEWMVLAEIEAGTITTKAEIDAAFA